MVAAAAESAGAPPAGSWRAAAAAAAVRLGAAADAAEAAAAAAAAAAAVAGGGSSGDADYSAETARRARSAAAKAAKAAAGATEEALAAGGARAARTIRRVRCEDLSLREFRAGVQARSEPLVITGLGDVLTEDGADGAELRWLRRHAASKTVAVSQRHAHTRSELRAADYELSTVGELLDAVDAGEADGRYLYDCSLPLKLPSLLQAVRVPRYFAHDFLMRTMRLHAFSASWPSLFVAAAGTQSSLHVDQWQGHFWMAMVRGTKRWTLFDAADLHLLSPDWGRNTLDPAMPPLDELDGLDDKTGSERRHALARLARRYEVDLGPGEVLYVPGGWPHHVRNLDNTVSFAGNYCDETNIERALADMQLMGARQGDAMADSFRAVDEVDFEEAGATSEADEAGMGDLLAAEDLVVPCSAFRSGEAAAWRGPLPDDVKQELAAA